MSAYEKYLHLFTINAQYIVLYFKNSKKFLKKKNSEKNFVDIEISNTKLTAVR